MQRLLATLTHLLKEIMSSDSTGIAILDAAIINCASYISAGDDLSCVKPAILTLNMLLSKNLTDYRLLMYRFSPSAKNTLHHVEDVLSSGGTNFEPSEANVQNFTLLFLRLSRLSDFAPTVGKFLTSFFKSFRNHGPAPSMSSTTTRVWPLWAKTIQDFVHVNTNMIDTLEKHLLPGLLQVDISETQEFLASLPLGALQHGDIHNASENDIRVCLLVINTVGPVNVDAHLGIERIPLILPRIKSADMGQFHRVTIRRRLTCLVLRQI